MSEIRFTDGVRVNTSGPYRILKLRDGYYVAGRGFLIPCRDHSDAEETRRTCLELDEKTYSA